MYESLFGLTGLPFQLSPDASFLFAGRAHRDALLALQQGLASGASVMLLTGDIGAGKTTLLRTFVNQLNPADHEIVQVSGAHLDAEALSDMLSISLGTPQAGSLAQRGDALIERLTRGPRPSLLVIDEAQHLSETAFALLQVLARASAAASSRLQICLCGQPELRAMIDAAPQALFRRQVKVDSRLGLLDQAETRAYIEHRLRKVGWNGRPAYGADAFGEIFARTGGVPRRLNLLCNRLMLAAYLDRGRPIDATAVALTAQAMQSEFGGTSAHPAGLPPSPGGAQRASDRPRPPGPLLCVLGGQCDHVQMATLLEAFRLHPALPRTRLVQAFQGNAFAVNHDLLDELGADATSAICLGVAAVPYPRRTADLAQRFEPHVERYQPSAVIVFNGSDAALAGARVAHKRQVPVFHIGAGQRSETRTSPEDLTRIEVDRLSDVLFTSEPESTPGLVSDGIPEERIHCVGSLAIDGLRVALRTLGDGADGPAKHLVPPGFWADSHGYGLVGLSAGGNIQYRQQLHGLLSLLVAVSRDLPLVWPVNKLTHQFAEAFELGRLIEGEHIACVPTQAHATLIDVMRNATCVLTDSWSMQDEAIGLGVPCLLLGEHAARSGSTLSSFTAAVGTSHLAANRAVWEILYNGGWTPGLPAGWDGKTAERVASYLSFDWAARAANSMLQSADWMPICNASASP